MSLQQDQEVSPWRSIINLIERKVEVQEGKPEANNQKPNQNTCMGFCVVFSN
jgi:hypothetical protein